MKALHKRIVFNERTKEEIKNINDTSDLNIKLYIFDAWAENVKI